MSSSSKDTNIKDILIAIGIVSILAALIKAWSKYVKTRVVSDEGVDALNDKEIDLDSAVDSYHENGEWNKNNFYK